MPNRYAVVCATCLYQSVHSSQWEANIDVAAHLRDNPTHSASVVEEGRRALLVVNVWLGSSPTAKRFIDFPCASGDAQAIEFRTSTLPLPALRRREWRIGHLAMRLHHNHARGGPA